MEIKQATKETVSRTPESRNDFTVSHINDDLKQLSKVISGELVLGPGACPKTTAAFQRLMNAVSSPEKAGGQWRYSRLPDSGTFGSSTETVVNEYQIDSHLPATSKVAALTMKKLIADLRSRYPLSVEVDRLELQKESMPARPSLTDQLQTSAPSPKKEVVSVAKVESVLDARSENIRKYLPVILEALGKHKLEDKKMVRYALATLAAECAVFKPIDEKPSKFSTSPSKKTPGFDFSAYEGRKDLGNTEPGDGAKFHGRGFVQITGRANYEQYGKLLNKDLVGNPELANDPKIAAEIFALYLKNHEKSLRREIGQKDIPGMRKVVNGGTHGLTSFRVAWNKLDS